MIRKGCLLGLLILSLPILAQAQHFAEEEVPVDPLFCGSDLFSESLPLNVKLKFDLKEYQRSKRAESYIPVQLIYQVNDTLEIERSMTIRARGEFRKNNCYLAPYWLIDQQPGELNSSRKEAYRIKVVTRCRESKAFTDYLLKEYLAYKIYHILSPNSFRVRLIQIKYVDSSRKNKITDSWAFMIEPEEMLADRLKAQVIKNDQLGMAHMNPETMDLVAMFQYMIGNPDYSIRGRHNIKLLGQPGYGTEGYTPVPYDFDYTGIVNASYGIPAEELGIQVITERLFMGPCRKEEDHSKAIEHIENYRDEIFSMIEAFEYLPEKPKKELMNYLEDFFELASNRKMILSRIQGNCR